LLGGTERARIGKPHLALILPSLCPLGNVSMQGMNGVEIQNMLIRDDLQNKMKQN